MGFLCRVGAFKGTYPVRCELPGKSVAELHISLDSVFKLLDRDDADVLVEVIDADRHQEGIRTRIDSLSLSDEVVIHALHHLVADIEQRFV